MPSHITRLLAALALMIVAAVAATPSLPTIGSFWTPASRTSTLRSLGGAGGEPVGQCTHLTKLSAATVPNWGYSLPHATTSSRTRSGVGRLTASLHELTNWPSESSVAFAWLINLFSWFMWRGRGAAGGWARLVVAS